MVNIRKNWHLAIKTLLLITALSAVGIRGMLGMDVSAIDVSYITEVKEAEREAKHALQDGFINLRNAENSVAFIRALKEKFSASATIQDLFQRAETFLTAIRNGQRLEAPRDATRIDIVIPGFDKMEYSAGINKALFVLALIRRNISRLKVTTSTKNASELTSSITACERAISEWAHVGDPDRAIVQLRPVEAQLKALCTDVLLNNALITQVVAIPKELFPNDLFPEYSEVATPLTIPHVIDSYVIGVYRDAFRALRLWRQAQIDEERAAQHAETIEEGDAPLPGESAMAAARRRERIVAERQKREKAKKEHRDAESAARRHSVTPPGPSAPRTPSKPVDPSAPVVSVADTAEAPHHAQDVRKSEVSVRDRVARMSGSPEPTPMGAPPKGTVLAERSASAPSGPPPQPVELRESASAPSHLASAEKREEKVAPVATATREDVHPQPSAKASTPSSGEEDPSGPPPPPPTGVAHGEESLAIIHALIVRVRERIVSLLRSFIAMQGTAEPVATTPPPPPPGGKGPSDPPPVDPTAGALEERAKAMRPTGTDERQNLLSGIRGFKLSQLRPAAERKLAEHAPAPREATPTAAPGSGVAPTPPGGGNFMEGLFKVLQTRRKGIEPDSSSSGEDFSSSGEE